MPFHTVTFSLTDFKLGKMKKSSAFTKTYCQLLKVWFGQRCASTWNPNLPHKPFIKVQRKPIQPISNSVRSFCSEPVDEHNKEQPIKTLVTEEKKGQPNLDNAFRTTENDVLNHEVKHVSLYYKVKKEDYEKFYQYGHLTRFKNQVATFRECGVMVRKPALEVFELTEKADMELPPMKILLYGQNGVGKSVTLSHVVHRLANQGYITVHFPNIRSKIMHRPHRPRKLLTQDDELLAHTDDAAHWLQLFKDQNADKLTDVKTGERHQFTIREVYDEGTPILDIVQFGIDREPFSTKCIGIVLKELRLSATDKNIRVLVALDGVNVFWKDLAHENGKLPAQNFAMFRHFMEMFEPTWTNGIIVGTLCCEIAARDVPDLSPRRIDFSPYNLLGKEGFKFLDPFLPIEVSRYTKTEARNCIDYYIDNHWISLPEGRTPDGKEELIALSARVPRELMDICSYW